MSCSVCWSSPASSARWSSRDPRWRPSWSWSPGRSPPWCHWSPSASRARAGAPRLGRPAQSGPGRAGAPPTEDIADADTISSTAVFIVSPARAAPCGPDRVGRSSVGEKGTPTWRSPSRRPQGAPRTRRPTPPDARGRRGTRRSSVSCATPSGGSRRPRRAMSIAGDAVGVAWPQVPARSRTPSPSRRGVPSPPRTRRRRSRAPAAGDQWRRRARRPRPQRGDGERPRGVVPSWQSTQERARAECRHDPQPGPHEPRCGPDGVLHRSDAVHKGYQPSRHGPGRKE